MNFLFGFLLAIAYVGLAAVAAAGWFAFKALLTVSAENETLKARVKKLEEKPEWVPLTEDDVRRVVVGMPARPGLQAVSLDELPRSEMPNQVAVDTFAHGMRGNVSARGRIASFEARRRAEAAKARTSPQGGPGESE
jgi:hypothetical protein